ncbi:1855_t:CDS:2 [Racocetra persica]|uniref:1855_t:CDS:1 n=1 Tax=Racocetra persica TaxID=160502 RepID=A0ACA9KJR0_9GLOM|nr:1855_t:CDS:2 [Racocetra persica]
MPRHRAELTSLGRKEKNEVLEKSYPLRSYPIQSTSFDHRNHYNDEREYSHTSRYARRDSRGRDRYYSRNDSHDRNVSRDYSYRSRRSPYRDYRSRSRSRERSFRDNFTRYNQDNYSSEYRRNYRSPEYRRSNHSPEYRRNFHSPEYRRSNHSPEYPREWNRHHPSYPMIKQENQNDQTYVQLLARQICNLTHQLEALQAGRSGFTQTITPISTEGVEIQDTDRQPTSVPTPIRTSPRMSELNLPSSHINEPKKLSSRFCSDQHLKPMDPIFKQVFRDEVVSILDQLPRSHQFKITKHFSQQLDHITCFTVPAIKEKVSPALLFTDNELIAVLKQLHKSRRGVWKNERRDQVDESRKRKHVSSRTSRKIRRRINGLRHMVYVNDTILRNCQPPTLHWNEYLRDLEYAVNDAALQSAEESDTDEELADNERENDERPENILDTNSVIKVYNKPWRSTRITCILHRCDEVTGTNLIRKRWYDDNYVDYKSRPKKDMPFWWISTRWSSSNIENSENEDVVKSNNRKNKRRDNYMKNAEIMQLD